MTDVLNQTLSSPIARQNGDWLNNLFCVCPLNKMIHDTALYDNSHNVFVDPGIPAPNGTPTLALTDVGTGNLTANATYSYYVVLYDPDRDSYGLPVQTGQITIGPIGDNINITLTPITNEDTLARTTQFKIFRNIAGGTTFFLVDTIADSTTVYKDDESDATISANDSLVLDNDPWTDTGSFGYAKVHKGFLFLGGPANHLGGTDEDHMLTNSKLNNPDAVPLANAVQFERGKYGVVRGFDILGEDLVVYKDRCIGFWRFSVAPQFVGGDGVLKIVNHSRGRVNHRCTVNVDGVHYNLDERGIYIFGGAGEVFEIADDLQYYWRHINWERKHWFHATYNDDRIWFFVCLYGDESPRHAFVLDMHAIRQGKGIRWWLDRYDQAFRDSTRYYLGNHAASTTFKMAQQMVPMAITKTGEFYGLNLGYRDGVHPYLTASSTVSASTTTTITGAGTYSLTNENSDTINVVGAYVRFPDLEGEYVGAHRVTGVSGTTLTLATTFAVAPPIGADFEVGGLPEVTYLTPMMSFGNSKVRKSADEIDLEFETRGADFTIRCGYSKDRKAIGKTNQRALTNKSGWSADAGDTHYKVNMGGKYPDEGGLGQVSLPIGGEGFAYLQMELEASGPDKPASIESININISQVEERG